MARLAHINKNEDKLLRRNGYRGAVKPVSAIQAVAAMGRTANGVKDTKVAVVTPAAERLLRESGGSGTINPKTGKLEFMGGGLGGAGGSGKSKDKGSAGGDRDGGTRDGVGTGNGAHAARGNQEGKDAHGGSLGDGPKGGGYSDARDDPANKTAPGIKSGKMQHSDTPTDSTLSHIGNAVNDTYGKQTTYDANGNAATIARARAQRPTADLIAKALGALAPGLMGPSIGFGNKLGSMAEDEAPANIDSMKSIPGDPGGFSFTKDGVMTSNRAGAPGSFLDKQNKSNNSRGSSDDAEERRKRRAAAMATGIGSVDDIGFGAGVLRI